MKRIKKLMAVMTAIASLAVSMCCIPANAAEVSELAAFETIDTLSASSVHYSADPYTTTRFFSFTTTIHNLRVLNKCTKRSVKVCA